MTEAQVYKTRAYRQLWTNHMAENDLLHVAQCINHRVVLGEHELCRTSKVL